MGENETKETGFGEGTLTEEELIMLDSLLYYSKFSQNQYKTVQDFVDDWGKYNYSSILNSVVADDSSGMSSMLQAISENEKLMNLEVVYSSGNDKTNYAAINAVCLRDADNNIYVLYAGNYAIGDYDGDENDNTSESTWQNNFIGGIQSTTREQEEAVNFFNQSLTVAQGGISDGQYNNVIVSGHSAGGNLAQIVTIRCGADITACLSVDGQGVSNDFKEENSENIENYGSKITCILPSKSYVGTLMYQIENAGYIYIDSKMVLQEVNNEEKLKYAAVGIVLSDILLSHFPVSLLDENWELRDEKEQSLISKSIHQMSVEFTDYASEDCYFSEEDKRLINNALNNIGIVFLEVLSDSPDWDRVKESLLDADTVTYFFRSAFGILPQEVEETLTGIYYEMIDTMEQYVENVVISWDAICNWFGEKWADLFGDATAARVRVDPLILDMDGDGFNIESKKYGTYFDLNCDGFAEKINWTNRDAILALDLNGNGKIDDGREVFGDYHLLADGSRAANGFEALAQYDTNGDGIIDEEDAIFSELRLWIDADGDGISGGGELKTLTELGIKAINLNYANANLTTGTEALIGNTATFVYEDDREGSIGELWVASDLFDTVETFITGISEAVNGLPDVRSYGHVNSLHNAMALDETGVLQGLVEQFVSETDNDTRIRLVQKILDYICETDTVEEGSRGDCFSAKKLAVIEKFMGEGFMGVNGANPNSAAAPILENVYKQIVEMYCFAMIGSKITTHLDKIIMYKEADGTVSFDTELFQVYLYVSLKSDILSEREFSDICAYLGYFGSNVQESYEIFGDVRDYFAKAAPEYVELIDSSVYGAIRGNNENNYLNGTNVADLIYGNAGNDTISGGNGNDLLVGGSGNDVISGGSGNDILYGDSGNDVLDGGAGDDILKDSEGDDTFVFARGYGHDVIMDEGGHNTLRFKGLKPTDVLVNGTGEYDVTIRIKGTDDTLIIKDFCKDGKYSDYDLEFDGGIRMHVTDKESPFRYIYGDSGEDVLKAVVEDSLMFGFDGDDTIKGSDGNDIIYGNQGNDTISAGTGNDILYGGDGNDVLDGGEGDDLLYGGAGDDTYIFGRNYGTDVISDEAGITTIKIHDFTLSDLTIVQAGEDVVITAEDTGDKLIINGFSQNPDSYRIQIGEETFRLKEQITDDKGGFVTGTDQYDYMTGSEENEYIFAGGEGDRILAGSGNDMIFGDSGNDAIFGEDGNDYISGGAGDDYINGGAGNDYIDGGTGDDFMDGGSGDDIYFFQPGSGKDSIMDSEGANTIIFGDGFTAEGIKAYRTNWNDLLITFEGFEDTLTIKNYCINEDARNFTLVFADGTVTEAAAEGSPLRTIYGTDGSEYMTSIYQDGITKIGQDGNDQLVGSDGNDYLYGGKGDDRITGNGGSDVLDGGEGSDFLYGGAGNDTYIFKKGYGTDTIGDGEGINTIEIYGYGQSQVKASRTNWNDMTIEFEGSEDKLVIEGFFTSEANRSFYLTFNGGGRVHATAGNSPLRTVYGTDSSDYILAMDDKGVTIMGEDGNDNLNGGNGADRLYGGSGEDQLHGNGGNDVLDGGEGNDFLFGGAGNDTYIFNMGYGTDTISDSEGINTIQFGKGLDADGLTAYRTNWNDLTITFEDTEDRLVIQGYFTSEDNRRFNVSFADGTRYAYDDAENPIHQVHATEYDDWMAAWSDEGVTLFGDGGNDHLTGGNGDDVLAGGTGNDYLAGGAGDDTYLFGKGDGQDTVEDVEGMNQIVFKGVNQNEVTFNKLENGDFTAGIAGESDTLTIKGFQSDNYTFTFEDGITGTVDTQTGEFTEIVTEDEAIQSMAEMLTAIYENEGMTPEAVTDAGTELLFDVSGSVSIREETDVITDQTDIQVMVLTENMAAFGAEDNISDRMTLRGAEEEDMSVVPLFVDKQVP